MQSTRFPILIPSQPCRSWHHTRQSKKSVSMDPQRWLRGHWAVFGLIFLVMSGKLVQGETAVWYSLNRTSSVVGHDAWSAYPRRFYSLHTPQIDVSPRPQRRDIRIQEKNEARSIGLSCNNCLFTRRRSSMNPNPKIYAWTIQIGLGLYKSTQPIHYPCVLIVAPQYRQFFSIYPVRFRNCIRNRQRTKGPPYYG